MNTKKKNRKDQALLAKQKPNHTKRNDVLQIFHQRYNSACEKQTGQMGKEILLLV